MTVGKLYAQMRLKYVQIYCINNRVINVSGSINCVCFDKVRERKGEIKIDKEIKKEQHYVAISHVIAGQGNLQINIA